MKSTVEVDTKIPGKLRKVVGKSLDSNEKVNYTISDSADSFTVKVETDKLGVLRGCTDTVFRLTGLTEKIYNR